ncbi:hypothetical protein I4U23_019693 [Adineta vaga]|nr:hypothetical protein I4U23_019693 [Adineta vaga]
MVIKALSNHAILLLIIISFIYITFDLPFIINSYYLGYDYPRTSSFCLFWYWIDYTLICTSLFLVATASVQRYVFLFKTYLLRIRRTRWILHYIPLIISIVYPSLFYFIMIVFYPCEYSYSGQSLYCSAPCYFTNSILLNIDSVLHSVLPLVVTVSAHVILVCWMIRSMWRLNGRQLLLWKRQKKLIYQIFAFSLLYVIGWSPSIIVSVLQAFSLNNFNQNQSAIIFLYGMSYFICPLQPFICLFVIPEPIRFIKMKSKELIRKFPRKTAVIFVPH